MSHCARVTVEHLNMHSLPVSGRHASCLLHSLSALQRLKRGNWRVHARAQQSDHALCSAALNQDARGGGVVCECMSDELKGCKKASELIQ